MGQVIKLDEHTRRVLADAQAAGKAAAAEAEAEAWQQFATATVDYVQQFGMAALVRRLEGLEGE